MVVMIVDISAGVADAGATTSRFAEFLIKMADALF
jgi:hypothetical protein